MNSLPRRNLSSRPMVARHCLPFLVAFFAAVSMVESLSLAAEDDFAEAVGPDVEQRVVIADNAFEQWVYGANYAQHQQVMESRIERKLLEISRSYEITAEERKKLLLAARAVAIGYEREINELRQRFEASRTNLVKVRIIAVEARTLQSKQNKIFGLDSFFGKVADRIITGKVPAVRDSLNHFGDAVEQPIQLNGEQVAKIFRKGRQGFLGAENVRVVDVRPKVRPRIPMAIDPDLMQNRHRANVEAAVRVVERSVDLRDAQQTALIELLLQELSPPKVFGDFDDLVVQYQFSQLPEDKLKPLFDEQQWPHVVKAFEQVGEVRLILLRYGLIDGKTQAQPTPTAAGND